MTNGWIDIKNTDMMLIMGGNPAENHPCGFKWAVEAKRNRNANMIVVDPRFTRTASQADLFLSDSRGQRHRLPRRSDQLRPRRTIASPTSTWSTTPTPPSSSKTGSSCLKTACFPASTSKRRPTTRLPGIMKRAATRPASIPQLLWQLLPPHRAHRKGMHHRARTPSGEHGSQHA